MRKRKDVNSSTSSNNNGSDIVSGNISLIRGFLRYVGVGLVCFLVGRVTRVDLPFATIKSKAFDGNATDQTPLHGTKITAKPALDWTPLLNDGITDPWKRSLYAQLDRVREQCGVLCRINNRTAYDRYGIPNPTQQRRYKTFETPIDCQQIFELKEIDAGDTSVPYPVPAELQPLYSLENAVSLAYYSQGRLVSVYMGGQALENIWTKEQIQRDLELLRTGQLKGTYGPQFTNQVRDALMRRGGLTGQNVLVVGSERPWVEVVALYAGAANVTTLEYGAITSQHPQIHTLTPDVFRQLYLEGTLPKYDAVLTYSSLEHSGLGRYGDALNPWGDILSLARCWCAARDNALLLLGVPVGPDRIEFNAHRIYGNIRMPLLTTNWAPADESTNYEANPSALGLHLFRKISQPRTNNGQQP